MAPGAATPSRHDPSSQQPTSRDLIYSARGLGCWHQASPATWSEELLVALHREVLLIPDTNIAPIPLIITEAGGRVSDLDGNDVLSGNGTVLASNGHIHGALPGLVRNVPSGRDYQALLQARR